MGQLNLPDPAPLKDLFDQIIGRQPWWKKYANTVTTVVFQVLNLVWILVATGVELPGELTIGVAVTVFIANIIGVRLTPNGVTDSTRAKVLDELEEYTGRHRRD